MMFLTKMDGYQKMCDTNQNVTKLGMTMKGVYYMRHKFFSKTFEMFELFFFKLKIFHHYHYTPSSRNKFSCLPHNHISKL
jgi:hypothetical protein